MYSLLSLCDRVGSLYEWTREPSYVSSSKIGCSSFLVEMSTSPKNTLSFMSLYESINCREEKNHKPFN